MRAPAHTAIVSSRVSHCFGRVWPFLSCVSLQCRLLFFVASGRRAQACAQVHVASPPRRRCRIHRPQASKQGKQARQASNLAPMAHGRPAVVRSRETLRNENPVRASEDTRGLVRTLLHARAIPCTTTTPYYYEHTRTEYMHACSYILGRPCMISYFVQRTYGPYSPGRGETPPGDQAGMQASKQLSAPPSSPLAWARRDITDCRAASHACPPPMGRHAALGCETCNFPAYSCPVAPKLRQRSSHPPNAVV